MTKVEVVELIEEAKKHVVIFIRQHQYIKAQILKDKIRLLKRKLTN